MHIGILGSYFNPPHTGHVLVAQQILDFTNINQVWFLPGFKSTFNKSLILVEHRLNMIKLIKLSETRVSTLEIDYQLDGNTINLAPLLKKHYPKHSFTFIIGSDQLPTFHKWGRWQELLRKMPFLVFPRAGHPLKPLYNNMNVLKHPLLIITNISSSLVRQRVKQKLPIDHLVPVEVKNYIQKHQLYL